ncbi:F-box protein At1g11270-like [Apium graveolens]|uniref:F-box protein At1g11270-like n=1 Tax=Apium graveolens TaxID=4045 RepID=UPI003D7A64F7
MALPADLIDEVLCRLPVKPLLRFRCVSKGWCSLIDSNAFAKKQLKTAIACNAGSCLLIVTFGDDRKFYFVGFDSLDDESAALVEIDDPLKSFIPGAQIMGGCNVLNKYCKFDATDAVTHMLVLFTIFFRLFN